MKLKGIDLGIDEDVDETAAGLGMRAYRELRRAILTHELQPEQKVSEVSLAKALNFGRSPIRYAIARATEEELIVSTGPKTQIIAPLTLQDITEIYTLRSILEPEAARRAAGIVNIPQLRLLNDRCRREYHQGNSNEELEFLEANKAFHLAIAKGTKSQRLVRWISQMQDAAMRVLWIGIQIDNRPAIWSHGHDDIIEALESGDSEEAAQRAQHHLTAGQQQILEVLMKSPKLRNVGIGNLGRAA